MKHMIDSEKFLDKLLYMGYMDEQKSEVEEVANRMTEDAYTKEEVIAMFKELQTEIEDLYPEHQCTGELTGFADAIETITPIIQQKIDLLQKQTTDNCDNCFNGATKGGCAVKELMKNKDCKYYMPRKINTLKENKNG